MPGHKGNPGRSRLDGHSTFLLKIIEAGGKDITLGEMAQRLETERGLLVDPSMIHNWLKKRGITLKKTGQAAEQAREDLAAAREAWFEGQPDLDPERLTFIDGEADRGRRPRKPPNGASTKMGRLRGRVPTGERCRASLPHGHWSDTSNATG